MKIYIAGPMRGYPEFNFHAFFKAEEYLHYACLSDGDDKIFNPAKMDLERGLDVTGLKGDLSELPDFDHRATMKECMIAITECTHIYMLKGWEHSTGARAEHALAVCLGLEVIYE